MQLRDKKILLTGASGGIGKAIASALLGQGARLLLAGRNLAALERQRHSLSSGNGSVELFYLDLAADSLPQQVETLLQQHPDIDVLINAAGVNLFSACDTVTPQQLGLLLDINLKGTLLLTSLLLPALKQRPEAAIINIGSTFGSIGYPGFAAYCASKFGLRGYSEALRRELAATSVSVFYLAPRATRTSMNADAVMAMNKELGVAMDDPQWVADQLVSAVQRNRFKVFLGWPEKFFVFMNSLFSAVVDRALIKQLPTIQNYLNREV